MPQLNPGGTGGACPGTAGRGGRDTAFVPRFPYHVTWGVTGACNARCVHCYADASSRSPRDIHTDRALQLVREFAALGIFDLGLTGGEPLLRRDLLHIVELATALGISVGLSTNGSLLGVRQARDLAMAGLERVQVSIDGLRDTHDRLRGMPGLFDRAMRALDACEVAGLGRLVCMTVSEANFDDLGSVLRWTDDRGIGTLNVSIFVPTGRGDAALALAPGKMKRLHLLLRAHATSGRGPRLSFHTGKQALVDPSLREVEAFAGCQAGRGTAYIGPEGDVTPCVLLPIAIGSVVSSSFEKVWREAPLVEHLRSRTLSGPCAGCALSSRCGGCRAAAFAEHGDPLGADPGCWLTTDT